MKEHLIIFSIFFFTALCVSAQNQPFEVFIKAVSEESAGFSGNKENLSKVFNQERIRLGGSFEIELWKYLGDDADKHYWISSFIESDSYLHGNKSLPELAFYIREKGLKLLEQHNDKKSLGRKVTLHREQAIYYHNIKNQDSATKSKNLAEEILKIDEEISMYVGGMTRLDKCIYSNLEKDTTFCQEEAKKPVEKIINGGVIAGKALSLPQPKYPKKVKKQSISGEVQVRVLILMVR